MKAYRHLMLFAMLAAGATAAVARTPGGVSIGGSAALSAHTGSQTAVAVGYDARATNTTGAITTSNIGGSASASGSSGTQVAIAFMPHSRARTIVGSIVDANTAGSASARGSVRSAVALSAVPGASTCVAVGAVGPGGSRASGAAGSVIAYDFGLFHHTRVRIGTSGAVC
jgi:hypothetical protein